MNKKFKVIKGYTFQTFDWKFYLINNPDLRNAGIKTQFQAWFHWAKFGFNESRRTRMMKSRTVKEVGLPVTKNIKPDPVIKPGTNKITRIVREENYGSRDLTLVRKYTMGEYYLKNMDFIVLQMKRIVNMIK